MLTSAGRRDYLVRLFRNALDNKGKVFAADVDPTAPALQEADMGLVVPAVTEPAYIPTLMEVCSRNTIGLVVPLNDYELPILAAHRTEFASAGVRVVVSEPDIVETCLDKLATVRFCRENGIATPVTTTAREVLEAGGIRQFNYPVVVKPRWGSGSVGMEVVNDPSELDAILHLVGRNVAGSLSVAQGEVSWVDGVIVQEFIEGVEYGLDVVNDLEGRYTATLARRKLLMRSGETDRATTVCDQRLARFGERLGKLLGHVGNLDCDVIEQHGVFYCLDLNPRFGGGYPFSHLAGADIPKCLVAWAQQETVDPRWLQIEPGVTGAKYDLVKRVASPHDS